MQLLQMKEEVDFHMELERQDNEEKFLEHSSVGWDILFVADCSLDKVLLLLLPEMEACHMEHMIVQDTLDGLCFDTVDRLLHQKEVIEHAEVNLATSDHIDLLQ